MAKSDPAYYLYAPQNLPAGNYDSPLLGELITGRVIEIPPSKIGLVVNDPDFVKSNSREYNNQVPLDEARAAHREPYVGEEV